MSEPVGLTGWIRRGAAAIGDQGLFAISSFVVNALLARWLGPHDYGAYALAFAVFLFLSLFHTALVSEPMLVYGGSRYGGSQREYLQRLSIVGLALGGAGGVAMLLTAAVVRIAGNAPLASSFLGFALACPCILYGWQMRRACYVRRRPQVAVSGGIVYLFSVFICVLGLRVANALDAGTAAACLGLGSLAAGTFLAWRLGLGWPSFREWDETKETVSAHWKYGRWASAAAVSSWVAANVFTLLLPLQAGLEGAGALTALVSLIMPAVHVETALSMLLLPALAERRGRPAFRVIVRSALLLCVGGAALQWLVFGLWNEWLVGGIYGPSYTRYSPALWLLGLIPVFFAMTSALGTALRALERPRRVFVAHAVAAIVAVGGGWALVVEWGFMGAAAGCALSYATTAVILSVSRMDRSRVIAASSPTAGEVFDVS